MRWLGVCLALLTASVSALRNGVLRSPRVSRLRLSAHQELLHHALTVGGGGFDVLQHLNHQASSLLLSLSDGGAGEGADLQAAAANAAAVVASPASPELSRYSTVDKTGFIGFFANYIEQAIDLGHTTLQGAGLKNTYGFSIILFTLLVKALTFPLTKTQIASTVKMQQLTPMQEKIKARYPDKADEQTKNQMLSQLFQAANVNPLAGCLPALAQIPIFISLYRALQNLVAENKLDEPFLWIPDLEGPIYTLPPSQSLDWVKSAVTGNPNLGWPDTLAFLSLPLILFISQTISQKVLQPKKDPNKVLSESEQISQGLINNLPFIVAFFSINVPAGLAVYWIINNIMTTVITVVTKGSIGTEPVTPEVSKMMAMLDAGPGKMTMRARGSGKEELRTGVVAKKSASKEGFAASSINAMNMASEGGAEAAEVSAASALVATGIEWSTPPSTAAAEGGNEEEGMAEAADADSRRSKKKDKPAGKKTKKRG